MRILLAEDERSLSKALKEILTRSNYSVDCVFDGEEAVLYSMAQRIPAEGTVVYLDPPYSNTEAGYNSTWTVADDDKLSAFMLSHPGYKYVLSSCSKDGKTTRLVETLRDSGMYDTTEVPHVYKAAKKSKASETVELILCSKNCQISQ